MQIQNSPIYEITVKQVITSYQSIVQLLLISSSSEQECSFHETISFFKCQIKCVFAVLGNGVSSKSSPRISTSLFIPLSIWFFLVDHTNSTYSIQNTFRSPSFILQILSHNDLGFSVPSVHHMYSISPSIWSDLCRIRNFRLCIVPCVGLRCKLPGQTHLVWNVVEIKLCVCLSICGHWCVNLMVMSFLLANYCQTPLFNHMTICTLHHI